ncbi:MAG: glutamate-1-semialdehyde-2,1-aminomutase [Deltaproteobacteria bacterium HGW-Deltaproteobacteria-14]|nr:MAG: glutamate-1-semialdehyde-2,1-aminomutase [Deltaproteobacteria bacterium HGW-Deltaproteobacteria-14]
MPPTTESHRAFEAASRRMPGGVNSPARACLSVGAEPVFIKSGEGAWLTDVDGNRYLDYVCGFGPMILGHGHPEVLAAMHAQLDRGLSYGAPTVAETTLAERVVAAVPSVDRMRLVSSGTEATMSALRVARGFTGRHKFVKLEGCYHGHADALLVKAGSGAVNLGTPNSAGVTPGAVQDTLLAPYNDLDAMRALFAANPGEIAAIIIEPVVGNMGVVPPLPGYLEGLRELTRAEGALLIFDEVMTGFRVALGGAQERFGITPDLTCFGKIIGGGMPIGAYGGRADVMGVVAPEGGVYQAGTNSGNPVCVAAGVATLDVLRRDPVHDRLEALGARLEAGLVAAMQQTGVQGIVQRVGSMITPFFTEGPVRRFEDVTADAVARFPRFFRGMRERGVMLPPSQYEAWFISAAHDEAAIDRTIEAARESLAAL